MLADLPPERLAELDQATLIADQEATLAAVVRIDEYAPGKGACLRTFVTDFQMRRIRDLLKETETGHGS